MAFKNAWITEEEKMKLQENHLSDGEYWIIKGGRTKSKRWTIDREQNIALIYGGELDREDYRKRLFIMLYKQFDVEHIIKFTLMNTNFSQEEKEFYKEKYKANLIERWKLIETRFPLILCRKVDETEIYEMLADALSVFGVSGDPERKGNVKAILEGKEGEFYYGIENREWNDNN